MQFCENRGETHRFLNRVGFIHGTSVVESRKACDLVVDGWSPNGDEDGLELALASSLSIRCAQVKRLNRIAKTELLYQASVITRKGPHLLAINPSRKPPSDRLTRSRVWKWRRL